MRPWLAARLRLDPGFKILGSYAQVQEAIGVPKNLSASKDDFEHALAYLNEFLKESKTPVSSSKTGLLEALLRKHSIFGAGVLISKP